MATTLKCLAKGTLGTGNATLVTGANTTIVKEIVLCNKTASAATATITFDGVNIVKAKSIAANDAYVIELHSVLPNTKLIEGLAGTGTAIDYYISGVEVA